MKVAIVSQPVDGVLPPVQNSIGIWTYEAARRLGDGCRVTVFAKSQPHVRQAGHAASSEVDGVSYRFVRVLPDRIWNALAKRVDRLYKSTKPFFASSTFHIDYAARVAAALWRSRLDVIHVHNFTGFVAILRATNPRAKLVLHMNGEWLSQLDYALMDKRIAKVDMVLGSSDHITGLVQARFPHHAPKCHTVYNGVDVDAFTSRYSSGGERRSPDPADGDPAVVLFVGRVSPEKGIHDLIDAFAIVAERHPHARLEIVGPPGAIPREFIVDVSDDELVAELARFYDDEEYSEHLSRRVPAHLRDRVVFAGPMSHDEVVERMGEASVLVNPSYSESFGMSLVEAMASETPVVATRAGGMPEIVEDGVTGYLIDRGDIQRLADAIDNVLSDASLRESMGRAGRGRVMNRFSWEAVSESLLTRYRQLTVELG